MESGIPVIASNTGGIRETIFNGKNGILNKPGDADALSVYAKIQVSSKIRKEKL